MCGTARAFLLSPHSGKTRKSYHQPPFAPVNRALWSRVPRRSLIRVVAGTDPPKKNHAVYAADSGLMAKDGATRGYSSPACFMHEPDGPPGNWKEIKA
jgi:hypothetical protein